MNKVAIIPARGGSKRIPPKSIKPFAGKAIIAWSIEAVRVFIHNNCVFCADVDDSSSK